MPSAHTRENRREVFGCGSEAVSLGSGWGWRLAFLLSGPVSVARPGSPQPPGSSPGA